MEKGNGLERDIEKAQLLFKCQLPLATIRDLLYSKIQKEESNFLTNLLSPFFIVASGLDFAAIN
jgi:hypothetical protein